MSPAWSTVPFGALVPAGLRAAGIRTLLPPAARADTGFDVGLMEPSGAALEHVDVLTLNRSEASILAPSRDLRPADGPRVDRPARTMPLR